MREKQSKSEANLPSAQKLARRPNRTSFQPGNRVALKHGAFAKREHLPAICAPDLAAADEFAAGVMADQGGESEISVLRRGYIGKLRELDVMVALLARDLHARGIFTPRGRVRNTYTLYLQTLDRWDRLARVLGLERRSKFAGALDGDAAGFLEAQRAQHDDDSPDHINHSPVTQPHAIKENPS